MRVLFVCLGNICRSPAAEGVFRAVAAKAGLDVHIASAGTGDYHVGELPDERMRIAARRRGYDLTSKAQQFKAKHFNEFDVIVAMDDDNRRNILQLANDKSDEQKVHRFADYVSSPDVDHVPDPYFGGSDGFDLVLDILEQGSLALLDTIRSRA